MPDLLEAPKKSKEAGQPELAKRELKRYGELKTTRDTVFLAPWQTLSDYFLPNLSDINTEKTEGTSGWSDRIYDTTAIEDARTCTTGQGNWATPSAEPWFQWSPPKWMNADENDDNAIWCGICTEIAREELSRSNYYQMSGVQYKSRTVFGTGHMHIEEGKRSLIQCSSRKIGTYCIALDDEGLVDTVYCEWKMSARAAAQKFGPENLPEKMRKSLDDGDKADKEHVFLHSIRPREELERSPGKIDPENKAIASIYIAMEEKWVVKESGYDEMPDSITRFDDWGTTTGWGYSPAFETLPNVRQLNYIVRFIDAQVELRANPRILAPIGTYGQMDLRPGGITPWDPNVAGLGKPEEWMTQADIKGTEESVARKQEAVHRMFYTDVFKALAQIKYKATAYEISQRLGENLEQLSPMFGRIITEKTGPDLQRIFGILFRAGKFPKPPRSMYTPAPGRNQLRLVMPEVTYTSRLALALKAMQNKATMDTLQFVSELSINLNRPELLDNWDIDAILRTFSINQGMSAHFERPMKEVIKLRAARAKQAAQERAMAMAESAAKAAGQLGKAPEGIQQKVSDQIPDAGAEQAA